jgi:PIN domain nuclease of toxin-antitoxin system
MKRVVLDASAVMTFFEDRSGARKVEELFNAASESKCELLMSIVNWGEVYYSVWRAKGPGVARRVIAEIAQLPIDLVEANYPLTKLAARLHAEHKLPYAVSFAASLADDRQASLATSDADFAKVEQRIDVLWVR